MNTLIPLSIALYASFMLGWIISKERYRQHVKKIMERVLETAVKNYKDAIIVNSTNMQIKLLKLSGQIEGETNFNYFLRILAEEFDKI